MTIVGVVVLLIAAIVLANQAGDGGSDGSSGDGEAQAESTAPSGEDAVQGSTSGVPTGYDRDEEGAQSAAANYAVALGGTGMFDDEQRGEIVAAVYAPDQATKAAADLDEAYGDPDFLQRVGLEEDGTAPAGMTFVSRVSPLGAEVQEYSADAATVSVWYSALFGLAGTYSSNPVTQSWYTSTYELVWVNGDWKVTDYSEKEGPVPVTGDQRASSSDEIAEAVEQYGGFTYAR